MAFDELTLGSFIWETTMRAADAVEPNLLYPPEERLGGVETYGESTVH